MAILAEFYTDLETRLEIGRIAMQCMRIEALTDELEKIYEDIAILMNQ